VKKKKTFVASSHASTSGVQNPSQGEDEDVIKNINAELSKSSHQLKLIIAGCIKKFNSELILAQIKTS
jgi:hypothetical protein